MSGSSLAIVVACVSSGFTTLEKSVIFVVMKNKNCAYFAWYQAANKPKHVVFEFPESMQKRYIVQSCSLQVFGHFSEYSDWRFRLTNQGTRIETVKKKKRESIHDFNHLAQFLLILPSSSRPFSIWSGYFSRSGFKKRNVRASYPSAVVSVMCSSADTSNLRQSGFVATTSLTSVWTKDVIWNLDSSSPRRLNLYGDEIS